MKDQELVNALHRLKVETGSLACMGCGHEHSCGVSGCAVMREAADRIANQSTHIAALQQEIEKLRGDLKLHRCATCDFWRENDPRCMNGQSQWGGKAVPKDNYCLYWEHHTDWIPVAERLPEDRSNVLVVAYWHERWGVYMGWCAPERAEWSVHVGIGDRDDVAVTYWMPLPEPPEEER